MSYAIIIIVLFIIVVLIWNFVPSIREKMRGYSTIVEVVVATVMQYFGMFAEALQEASASGYIPENYAQIVPGIICVYLVAKRFQSRTAVGGE